MDDRASDEATGLPPLENIEQSATIVVLAWAATEGLASHLHADEVVDGIPVRYLHVRGIVEGGPTGVEWAQIHLAVPVDVALDVAAALAKGSTDEL